MTTVEVLKKISESIDYSLQIAEQRKAVSEPNSEDYYRALGEIDGMNVSKVMIYIAIKLLE